MPRKAEVLLLALFAALLGYTLLEGAGGDSNKWLVPGAGLAAIAAFVLGHAANFSFRRFWPLLVLPVCIASQLLPWPARSVAVSLTIMQLWRVIVYLVCFAVMREVATATSGSECRLFAIPLAFRCVEAV